MSKAGASLATCYGPVSADVITRAENIRLLILDVDGVLSDGLIYMGNNGEELKAFNVRDGYGIRCALTSGCTWRPLRSSRQGSWPATGRSCWRRPPPGRWGRSPTRDSSPLSCGG